MDSGSDESRLNRWLIVIRRIFSRIMAGVDKLSSDHIDPQHV
jgi:hypothetical protein